MTTTQAQLRTGSLTMLQGSALTVGAVLGTGVISLPGLAARIAGPASMLSWLLLVIASVPLAATFGALGARFPDSGGVASYARSAFGPKAGAVVGWCFFFAVPIGAPAASMMAGHYVAAAFGGGRVTVVGVAAALILGVGGMNAFGVRLSGRVQLALAAVLAGTIVVTVAIALPHARPDAVGPIAPHGWPAVITAAGALVWAFAGWEAVAPLAAEYRSPHKDVPLATTIALVVIGALYLGLAATTILVLGPRAGDTVAPLSDLMALALGEGARPATAFVALLLTIGAMNAYFAGASKLGSALGRDGALPHWLADGSLVGEVPRRSLLVVTVLAGLSLGVAALSGLDFDVFMVLATGSFGVVYVLGTASAVKLFPPGWTRTGAIIGFVTAVALAVSIGPAMLWAAVVSAAAVLYMTLRGRRS